MKNVNFKLVGAHLYGRLTIIALVIGIVMISCGGSGSKQKNAINEIEKEIEKALDGKSVSDLEKALDVKNVSSKWENNEYTKKVPKPDIDVESAGESVLGYSANFKNATLEQIKEYSAKVKAAGFSVGADENEFGGDTYIFSAENSDGWSVLITWSQGQAGLLISKP